MPEITGRTEITLSVRDVQLSAAWYCRLLDMDQTYDHMSDDGRMRYICLVEPKTAFVLCLVGHADNSGTEFSEFRTGLDHLEFLVAQHADLADWAARLDGMGVEHSGVKDLDYTPNAMLTFRDPDNIQLEFLWRAPPNADSDSR